MHPEKEFLLFGITPEVPSPVQLTQVNDLFPAGLDYLYIRSRATDAAVWHKLLEEIDPAFYPRLLLPGNAPAEVAGRKYNLHFRESERGLGLGEDDGRREGFSTSVHALTTVPALASLYQYVFYSPLFPSISKPGYQPQVALNTIACQLADWQQREVALPGIIGLGGVNTANIGQVKAAGFQGAALLGALWQSECPVMTLASIRKGLG